MLRDNKGRARAARLVFLLLLLVSAGLVLLTIAGQSVSDWDTIELGISSPTTMGIYYLYCLLSLGYLALLIAGYVVLIMWLRRAYYNLHQLPGIRPEFSDGWAAGAWFVPFLNFVRPYTIMREVWQYTQRAAWGRLVEPTTILGWWWAAFVLKMLIGRFTSHLGSKASGITQADLLASMLEAGVQVLAAGLTWHVIGRAAAFEEELALRQQVNKLGQAPPSPTPQADQSDYALEEGY